MNPLTYTRLKNLAAGWEGSDAVVTLSPVDARTLAECCDDAELSEKKPTITGKRLFEVVSKLSPPAGTDEKKIVQVEVPTSTIITAPAKESAPVVEPKPEPKDEPKPEAKPAKPTTTPPEPETFAANPHSPVKPHGKK